MEYSKTVHVSLFCRIFSIVWINNYVFIYPTESCQLLGADEQSAKESRKVFELLSTSGL